MTRSIISLVAPVFPRTRCAFIDIRDTGKVETHIRCCRRKARKTVAAWYAGIGTLAAFVCEDHGDTNAWRR